MIVCEVFVVQTFKCIFFVLGEGAFAVYLEPWHADIFDFLELRKNHGKVKLHQEKITHLPYDIIHGDSSQ